MVDLGTGKKVSTPFPAIVGQEQLKRVLLALVIEEELGGALLRGEKGTAKSTAVRAMADVLPPQTVVADCPYGCPPDGIVDGTGDRSVGDQCTDCRERDDPPVETRPTPIVTLPLGATRDRVVGTLSVADALDGDAEFDPGLLARANRGILYVDEINLLPDHLVDVLLDAAAMGTNRVERDGISVAHPADLTLIGTMNPEEGDLRPQLRDRFDLCVDVSGSDDVDERVEVLNRVVGDGSGRGPERDLRAEFASETAALRERVHDARDRHPDIPDEFKREIAELCRDADVDGHRADFAIARASRGFAALDGRPKVIESDVVEAAEYALAHRMCSRPFEDAPDPDEIVGDRFDNGADGGEHEAGDDPGTGPTENDSDADEKPGNDSDADERSGNDSDADERSGNDSDADERSGNGDRPGANDRHPDANEDDDRGNAEGGTGADENERERSDGPGESPPRGGEAVETAADSGESEAEATPLPPGGARTEVGEATAPEMASPIERENATSGNVGRGEASPSPDGRGSTVRTAPADGTDSIDPAATVRMAARNGRSRPIDEDLRQTVQTGDARTLTVFVADASASMAPAMRAAKGVVLELLRDAYAERDEVALVAFGGDDAEVLLPPTTSVSLAARHLKELPSADRTPLPAGLHAATELIEREDPDSAAVVLVSDGRANVANGSPTAATRTAAERLGKTDVSVLVVDAGESRAGLLDTVCEATNARRTALAALSPEMVIGEH